MEILAIRVGNDNFSYLIVQGNHASLVDPGMDPDGALVLIKKRDLKLDHVIATHHHGDHTSSIQDVVDRTGASVIASEKCSSMIGGVDRIVRDGNLIRMSDLRIEVMETPGHTEGGICLIVGNAYLITGDTLFIGDCGRCDLPGSSLVSMFNSLQRIKGLSDDLIVLPGHDYGPKEMDTLGEQKRTNPTLIARDLGEFSGI